jgi:predicted GIY-YIG superfamily endonuclease
MDFYVYMLLCSDHSIYTGHTDDLEARDFLHTGLGGTAGTLPSACPLP